MARSDDSFFQPRSNGNNCDPIDDKRLFAPSSMRNKDVILKILQKHAPPCGEAMEIACGSGEHGAYIARAMPDLNWHPTDIEENHLASANAHGKAEGIENLKPAIYLDVTTASWPLQDLDLIYNANMIHISPWECCLALMAGAGKVLKSGGVLFMYGPYMREGKQTSQSNEMFDTSLKSRNQRWGIRPLEDVIQVAAENGLYLVNIVSMPANNFSVIYKKR